MRVELSDEATAQADKIDEWWRHNRTKAPNLFAEELDRALDQLGATPSIGKIYRAGSRQVRQLLLDRTHHHLYFVQEADRIYVLAIWGCPRGRGPRL